MCFSQKKGDNSLWIPSYDYNSYLLLNINYNCNGYDFVIFLPNEKDK